ncbi:MAG TPA: hypothetical protein VEF89_03135 [Solirubrobacteraceae bacterium]|nr:hypothetical protein [Solirubrobacteraceae bacterium]
MCLQVLPLHLQGFSLDLALRAGALALGSQRLALVRDPLSLGSQSFAFLSDPLALADYREQLINLVSAMFQPGGGRLLGQVAVRGHSRSDPHARPYRKDHIGPRQNDP